MGSDMYMEMHSMFGNEGVHEVCGTRHPGGLCPGPRKVTEIVKTPRVYEWRITRQRMGLTIRLWISQDAILDPHAAKNIAIEAVDRANLHSMHDFASSVMEFSTGFNSVEVCDESGDGVCIHRDWP